MSSKQNKGRDPEKRAAKRQRQRDSNPNQQPQAERKPKDSQSQMTHASSGKATKKRREGERHMEKARR